MRSPHRDTARGLLTLCALAAFWAGCQNQPHANDAPARAASAGSVAPATSAATTGASPSLFEMTFELTDQDGRTRHIADFRGKPFVASMIYTNCTSVCPRVTADLQALERALPAGDRRSVRFVLFSLDPERDTPEALRRFARERGLDPDRWTLLSTDADDMRTLAAVLGVRFRPDEGGEIAHTATIAVVDADGVVRHQQKGLTGDSAPLLAALRAARVAPRAATAQQ